MPAGVCHIINVKNMCYSNVFSYMWRNCQFRMCSIMATVVIMGVVWDMVLVGL
jgi:uncharacterized membrane protein YciS (DUF1049 family)